MQFLRLHPTLLEAEIWGWGPAIYILTSPWVILKHCNVWEPVGYSKCSYFILFGIKELSESDASYSSQNKKCVILYHNFRGLQDYLQDFKKNVYVFIYKERGKEGERVGEKHQLVASHTCLNGDRTHNLGMCTAQEWNQWPFALQDNAQPTESHWLGHL